MNKYSFHVSTLPEFWEKGLNRRYIAEPYVANYYGLSASENITIADFTRKNKLDYQKDSRFLDRKVKQYRSQIIKNLNNIHRTDYSIDFWTKALGLGFVRFVHILYDGYKIASQFDPKQHVITVLDKESYCHFQDFEEFRNLFQNSDFGYEQMFSLYIATFYSGMYEKNCIKVEKNKQEEQTNVIAVSSFWSRLKKITLSKLYKKTYGLFFKRRKPIIGILHSFFSSENMEKLYINSHGRINVLEANYNYRIDSYLESNMRKCLYREFLFEDHFDHFFEKALEYFFPTLYLENFQEQISHFQSESKKFKGLQYLISEAWIGDSRLSFFIAVLQDQGVFHIYNEHNYLEHFLLGNHIGQIDLMCDQYYSLGWEDNKFNKIKKGASLFPFSIKNNDVEKSIKYLYIGSLPAVKMAEVNCAYGEQQENAFRYIEYIEGFYSNLSKKIMNGLVYRPYPNSDGYWIQYNIMDKMKKYYPYFRAVDDFSISSKMMMLKSRLTIIDYLSTAYLESLILNTPTIILFDPLRYFFEEGYEDFFDNLMQVGICQTNPKKAAEFINNMGDNIEEWWNSENVQEAKKKFLTKNIGDPEDAVDFYLSLLD